jgi:hypothetical protein
MAALQRLAPGVPGREGVRLLKHLPFSNIAVPPAAKPQSVMSHAADPVRVTVPTHIVYRGVAYGLERGAIVVGRDADEGRRTIIVDSASAGISRSHCEIGMRNGELWLRDTSRFGTFVNEHRIDSEVMLKPADIIRIGTPGAELQVVALESADGS